MDTFKNEMVWYGIGNNETVGYFNRTVNGTLLRRSGNKSRFEDV